jgi:hypothetical protein
MAFRNPIIGKIWTKPMLSNLGFWEATQRRYGFGMGKANGNQQLASHIHRYGGQGNIFPSA